jgi:hypothetical protein
MFTLFKGITNHIAGTSTDLSAKDGHPEENELAYPCILLIFAG